MEMPKQKIMKNNNKTIITPATKRVPTNFVTPIEEEEDSKPAAAVTSTPRAADTTATATSSFAFVPDGKHNHDEPAEVVTLPTFVVPSEVNVKAAKESADRHLDTNRVSLLDESNFFNMQKNINEQFEGLVDEDGSVSCEEMKKGLMSTRALEWKKKKEKEFEDAVATGKKKNELNWDAVMKHVALQALEKFVP